MPPTSRPASVLAALGRSAIATGALCGAFVAVALLSFTAALIGRIRPGAPPVDL